MSIESYAELTAGDAFSKWYLITYNGSAIADTTTVRARMVDTVDPRKTAAELIATRALTWDAAAGTDGNGAWVLSFTGAETQAARETAGDSLGPLAHVTAIIEIEVGSPYSFTRHDRVSIGKGVID